ncbi:lysophospholipid acyltransferase family protein [sulfur-oxidizing endosymbiont of Gigantopelta aegis]|uniref:lysophospholipid acyltransferase family protein n=1 Tax=sulfur-oxidizing endosymbiont of Gigantopelta aegis TaxID=2794934 RepID=UPI0018DCF944|nr:lysophospholipid acyltransferase family protein [sulfur-oxidizing endosymbiont of Gigantopelta aegis]
MNRMLQMLFFALLVKPLVFIVLGLNLRGRNNLPEKGPAIIAANHNSHLDTLVLMSLYPLRQLHKVRPVAAVDYFLTNPLLAWFALNCIGIIPLERKKRLAKTDLFSACHAALDQGDILLIFPEGSRGNPEQISTIKKGIFHIVNERSDTYITPVLMHGLGRALPKGEALLVPFNCDVVIAKALQKMASANDMVSQLKSSYQDLQQYCVTLYTPKCDSDHPSHQ